MDMDDFDTEAMDQAFLEMIEVECDGEMVRNRTTNMTTSNQKVGSSSQTRSSAKDTDIDTSQLPPPKRLKPHLTMLVNRKQTGNPLLRCIRNTPWQFADIAADYEMGPQIGAIFLSLKYHAIKPQYIHDRIKTFNTNRAYRLRVLVVLIDVRDPYSLLKTLTKIAILADFTLMPAWSDDEAATIFEIYKQYEVKSSDRLRGKSKEINTQYTNIINALITLKPLNRTDSAMLLSRFKTLENIIKCPKEEMERIPGLGTKKKQILSTLLNSDFLQCKKPVLKNEP